MKILIWARTFHPNVGGTEQVTWLLAREWVALGHEVRVVTRAAAAGPEDLGFPVLRRPGYREILRQVRWCDVYYQAGLNLRGLWPLLPHRRPWFVTHHMPITEPGQRPDFRARVARVAARRARGIAVSRAVAAVTPGCVAVIPNPVADVFRAPPGVPRDRELVFVGRLIAQKGGHVLLDALDRLRRAGRRPALTIVGAGPEEDALREQAARLGVAEQVAFAGVRRGADLAALLARHQVVVVPSIGSEGFGLVALEGIACGCVAVGSAVGGLPEAIGPCGLAVPDGDPAALAAALETLLADPDRRAALRARAPEHVAAHQPRRVAESYLQLMQPAARRRAPSPLDSPLPRATGTEAA
ncbi:MAG TPA: glycosyltransferase family 4 protein [Longimicrobium sp.]|jgi:glycosyltransferase involved in cell wall biosynthesis